MIIRNGSIEGGGILILDLKDLRPEFSIVVDIGLVRSLDSLRHPLFA